MKQEALRFDRVTSPSHVPAELRHFSLRIFSGEIMGILPLNAIGLRSLLNLLRQNTPIHYGFVYYREHLVNDWRNPSHSYNRIGIIQSQSGLADDLTVADNVFVLRPGFRKRYLSRRILADQLTPFLREINVDISANATARDLSPFERFVVELVKAVVAGAKLIAIHDAATVISDANLHKLHDILRHYAAKGISFLYISNHYEELRQVAHRAALMMNGQIIKILDPKTVTPETINAFGAKQFINLIRTQNASRPQLPPSPPAIEFHHLAFHAISDLSLRIAPGECVVLQDLDNAIIDNLIALLSFLEKPASGSFSLPSNSPSPIARRVAIIQKLATNSMLFPELSYFDNLCFTMDHLLPRFWLRSKPKLSVRREVLPWLGAGVFEKSIDELSLFEKYDLIYARILLQRPQVVFCVQPFMQADVELRMHIWTLIERLLRKGIAVCILAVNLSDSLSLADRLVCIQGGRVASAYDRAHFGTLPENIPWQFLWHPKK